MAGVARAAEKLSAVAVAKQAKPGLYGDGRGLWLQVRPGVAGPSKSWVLRYMRAGRARTMGLGPYPDISLADARERAAAARRLLIDGRDPIEERDRARAATRLEAARAVTFRDAAERYIAAHRAGWKNAKHAAQWTATLDAYTFGVLGSLPVAAVDVGLVLKVLEPIWTAKPETAARVRGRIEAILDWATARGLRVGENPARWRGHLDKLLPARAKVARVKHHAALPYADLPAFMVALRSVAGIAARALEFAILTAARTGEVIGARWSEVDLDAALWTVPADRMKAGREHRVALAGRALEILRDAAAHQQGDFIFPGAKPKQPLSNMALLAVLKRMGRTDLTTHGFRSTFKDWASEQTAFPGEVTEMALAHVVTDKVEAAYRRGDLLQKRRDLAATWSGYCGYKE